MNLEQLQSRPVYTIAPEQPLAQAAQLMLDRGLGALVVVEERDGARRPVGMLTDRDVVRGQLQHRSDLHCLLVADVMSAPAVCVSEQQNAEEAVALLRARALRRAPVVSASGALVGIVSLDDLLPAFAGELNALAELMGTYRRDGHGRH